MASSLHAPLPFKSNNGEGDIYGVDTGAPEADAEGVKRIEALYEVFGSGWKLYALFFSLYLLCYATSLASNTTAVYLQFATSNFGQHSLLGTISIANNVISGVCKPFLAKLANVTSRPTTYVVSVVFYAVGFAILASSTTVSAVAAGQLLNTVGFLGLDFVTNLVLADTTPLEWRIFAFAIQSSPYLINAFVSGYITDDLGLGNGWRWGFAMFCIIVPVAPPALAILFWADVKAKRTHVYTEKEQSRVHQPILQWCWHYWVLMDGSGLILLAMSWSLILLPFSLSAGARGGWENPSIIAMLIVGVILFPVFVYYEWKIAAHPLVPRRVLNRTFVSAIAVDVIYYISVYVSSVYYTSYVFIVTDWSIRDYTFWVNSGGVCLVLFTFVAGFVHRFTHRYKLLQYIGLAIIIVGNGLAFAGRGRNIKDAILVSTPIIQGAGGAFVLSGTIVAVQASVPHADLATVVALLALWTSLAGAVGGAISSAVWTDVLPKRLATQLASDVNSEMVLGIYGDITAARFVDPTIRPQVIEAYSQTVYYLFLVTLIVSFVPFIPTFFASNFYLGKNLNAVEDKQVAWLSKDRKETQDEEHKG